MTGGDMTKWEQIYTMPVLEFLNMMSYLKAKNNQYKRSIRGVTI